LDVCLQICCHCIAPIQMFVKVLLLCPQMAVKLIMKRSNKNSHRLLRLWTQLLPIVAFQNHKQESQVTDPSLCSISSPPNDDKLSEDLIETDFCFQNSVHSLHILFSNHLSNVNETRCWLTEELSCLLNLILV